jgi:hypothetical protein
MIAGDCGPRLTRGAGPPRGILPHCIKIGVMGEMNDETIAMATAKAMMIPGMTARTIVQMTAVTLGATPTGMRILMLRTVASASGLT